MSGFRAFIMGADGHVQARVDFLCDTEKEALEQAKQLVDGHDIELWQLNRHIRTFKTDDPDPRG